MKKQILYDNFMTPVLFFCYSITRGNFCPCSNSYNPTNNETKHANCIITIKFQSFYPIPRPYNTIKLIYQNFNN